MLSLCIQTQKPKNNMKKLLSSLFLFGILCSSSNINAADTISIRETKIPILLEREDNVLFYLRLDAKENKQLDKVTLKLSSDLSLKDIKSVKLYYGGTEALHERKKERFAPVEYVYGKRANNSYSILKGESKKIENKITINGNQKLFPGRNYFWVALQLKPKAKLINKIQAEITSVVLDGEEAPLKFFSEKGIKHRIAKAVRTAGDDGVAAYRIPGLVTTKKGTLLGVYDVRYNNSVDLQEYVDVGLSRSVDGGDTWEKMRLPLSFGEYDGLPKGQNGVGDPSILVDERNNTVWIAAAWTHGMGNQRAWWSSYPGMGIERTAQLVLTKSTDDGRTWSKPINITSQVKKAGWFFLLQGPGRGITMQDGTLVFPIQYIAEDRVPCAGIMYSKDGGENWTIHNAARVNTTEAQVVEIEPGVLMLNMRDNRGGSRAVSVTKDFGETWTEHVSNRSALREPVCMASLIKVEAKDNVLNKDLLIFSNPDTVKDRKNITIKVSLDNGVTWLKENQLLLDEGHGWGYSCLTMIDSETLGILYESSVAHMTFQKIKIKDLIK